jgi:glucokinase
MTGLLFDLGGTYLRAGVAEHDGSVGHIAKTRIASIADGLSACCIWPRIADSMLAYEDDHRYLLEPESPIVLSFPGPIHAGKQILQAPTVSGSGEEAVYDLPDLISRETKRHVWVLNDVSAAAWYIARTTSRRRFLVVTVSSGIGSKLFDLCHASGVLDSPAFAGEIGHVVVDDSSDAPICDCGGRGHLGAISSGRGIERIARKKSGCVLTNERDIVPGFLAGDPWFVSLIRESTRPLARSLLTVAMAAGLEKVFIMGGFANALGGAYIDLLSELARDLSCYEVARSHLASLFEGMPLDHETSLYGCAAFLDNEFAAHRKVRG